MSLYQQSRKLLRLWMYIIVGLVFVGIIWSVVSPLTRRLIHPCDEPPVYTDDVPPEIRTQLDALHARALLYCSGPVEGLDTIDGRVYWGSDGVSSVLYFPSESLEGVGVTRYGFGSTFGDAFVPLAPGASPPEGFREDVIGREAITNQAPDGASFFYRLQGAPGDDDRVAAVTIRAPAEAQQGLTERDVYRDLEMLWDMIRRKPPVEVGSTSVQVPIAIVPESWQPVRQRTIDPELADEEGQPSFQAIRDLAPTEPMLYQTVSGPLGTTVWVAGVVTGTRPTLVLTPIEAAGGDALEPFASSRWTASATDVILQHFAFPPLPPGATYEASYWHDPDAAAGEPPAHTWTVIVPVGDDTDEGTGTS